MGAGMHGCNAVATGGRLTLCETSFAITRARFQVVEVNRTVPMLWDDLRLLATAPGFRLRSGNATAPLVGETKLTAVLSGPIRVGQVFDVCGSGVADLRLRDVRPIGAQASMRVPTLPCDQPAAVEVVRNYDMTVFGAEAGVHTADLGANCIRIPAQEGWWTATVDVDWTPSLPAPQNLTLWTIGANKTEQATGTSPLHATIGPFAEAVDLVLRPEGPGAAKQDARLVAHFGLAAPFAAEPAACPKT
ncbi:MAG: hypothetical protein ABR562_05460 [Thermoplasmatota archaeon]